MRSRSWRRYKHHERYERHRDSMETDTTMQDLYQHAHVRLLLRRSCVRSCVHHIAVNLWLVRLEVGVPLPLLLLLLLLRPGLTMLRSMGIKALKVRAGSGATTTPWRCVSLGPRGLPVSSAWGGSAAAVASRTTPAIAAAAFAVPDACAAFAWRTIIAAFAFSRRVTPYVLGATAVCL